MTVRLALSLSAAAALGSALASLAVGTPTMFGVSLAASMALGLAADLAGRCSPMSKRLVKVQEFDRSTLLDIWLDGFTSGLTTAAKNLTGCSGEMAAEFADEIARGIMNDPAAMEMVRREVRERVTGMFDPNADTRELWIDTAGGAR